MLNSGMLPSCAFVGWQIFVSPLLQVTMGASSTMCNRESIFPSFKLCISSADSSCVLSAISPLSPVHAILKLRLSKSDRPEIIPSRYTPKLL